MLSKTLAEEAAWKFAKENGIDMVTLNPGWVIGPLSHPTPSLSVQEVLKLIKGSLHSATDKNISHVSVFYLNISTCFISILNQLHPTWSVNLASSQYPPCCFIKYHPKYIIIIISNCQNNEKKRIEVYLQRIRYIIELKI